jgi:hypothetical protein
MYCKELTSIYFNNSFFSSLIYILLFFLNLLLLYSIFTLSTLSLKWLLPLVVMVNFLVFDIPISFRLIFILVIALYIYYYNFTLVCSCDSIVFVHQFIFYFLDQFTIFITWLFHSTSLYFLVIIVVRCMYSVFQTIF